MVVNLWQACHSRLFLSLCLYPYSLTSQHKTGPTLSALSPQTTQLCRRLCKKPHCFLILHLTLPQPNHAPVQTSVLRNGSKQHSLSLHCHLPSAGRGTPASIGTWQMSVSHTEWHILWRQRVHLISVLLKATLQTLL